MPQTVGIVGYGAFGSLVATLSTRFAPGVNVRICSSSHEPDGVMFFSSEETAASDALVLAVPIHAYEETLKHMVPLTRSDTVLIDVATVKVHTIGLLKMHAAGRHYVAMHPMWGPESYEKRNGDVRGFRIVVTDHTISQNDYDALSTFLRGLRFDVVEMTAERHDKHLAETLFLTHFIGQIVSRAEFERTEIDTVSFGYLMDAMESVRHDTQLFEDVFKYNPYCKDVLDRFEQSETEVRKFLEKKE